MHPPLTRGGSRTAQHALRAFVTRWHELASVGYFSTILSPINGHTGAPRGGIWRYPRVQGPQGRPYDWPYQPTQWGICPEFASK